MCARARKAKMRRKKRNKREEERSERPKERERKNPNSPDEVLDADVDQHARLSSLAFSFPVQQRRDPVRVRSHEVDQHVVVDVHVALLPRRVRVDVEAFADLGLREVAVEL